VTSKFLVEVELFSHTHEYNKSTNNGGGGGGGGGALYCSYKGVRGWGCVY